MQVQNLSIHTHRASWEVALRRIQQSPLLHCPSFPEVAARWNRWWSFEADCPLMIAQAPKTHAIRWDKAFDLLATPEEWLNVRRRQVEATHHAGESLPFVRADIGPVALAAFLGAPLHFAVTEGTVWQSPTIESWSPLPRFTLEPHNRWLSMVLALLHRIAEDARGRYLVCLPDLTGAVDVLANLRTPERLCLDLFGQREAITAAADQVVDAWETVFCRMYNLVLGMGAGITQWVSCWADAPFTVPTCDFNALIGPADFNEICLPSLTDQARRAGRCALHLDGPDAARHGKALAETPDITAVQYTPGAGTPSALAMLPLFRMFQEHKTPLFIETPQEEAKQLAMALDTRGTAIRVSGLNTPAEADALIEWRDKTFLS